MNHGRRTVSEVMKEIQEEKKTCMHEISVLEKEFKACMNDKDEVATLMKSLERFHELAGDANNLQAIGQLFVRVDLRMFLRFLSVQKKKRTENKLVGGVLTFGESPLPMSPYVGPTNRAALKMPHPNLDAQSTSKDTEPNCSGPEEKSLGNVNRDDRIRTCDLLTPSLEVEIIKDCCVLTCDFSVIPFSYLLTAKRYHQRYHRFGQSQERCMPRKFRLTWQAGSNGRGGRWRKKYNGKTFYFEGGSGKYDKVAYDAAVANWEVEKRSVDANAPRPHQEQYERTIAEWEQVLAWSNRHGHQDMAAVAYEKMKSLRAQLEAPVLAPLRQSDWFVDQITMPTIPLPDDLLKQTAATELTEADFKFQSPMKLTPERAAELSKTMDGSLNRISQEIWKDRLDQQQLRAAVQQQALHEHVDEFVKQKTQQVEVGELSIGRVYAIQLHLSYFRDWLGRDTDVSEIDGSTLLKYQSHLLDNLKAWDWSRTTAQHYLKSVKAFIRWLWQIEAIPALPRVLADKSGLLNIGANTPRVIVYTSDELNQLLNAASDRTKLYILLMLNCGMTQKDISDLKVEEVDWKEGRIIRKRSKTSDFDNVPTVNYLLWKETFRLLQKEQSGSTEGRVLVNANGSAICSEQYGTDGKFRKTDNVKNAFDRLSKKVGIKKTLKSFKKTSASLLRGEERFQSLEDLFLGHAPQKISDKHYTQVPGKLLDKAILWLETQFQFTLSARSEEQTAT
jgi:integrase